MSEMPALTGLSEPNLPSKQGFPSDWYWRRQDGTLFSSNRIAVVPEDDDAFLEWSADGRVPSPYPKDEDGKDSEAELQAVLTPYNLSATLGHYARAKTWALRMGGAQIGDYFVPTDADTLSLLNGLKGLAEQDPNGTFPFDDGTATGATLSAEQAIGLATAVGQYVQSTFTKRVAVLAGIADGSIATKTDVDKALVPPKASRRAKG